MADRHSKEARSRNMAAVKSKNTKPEMLVRRGLHGMGYRYGLHYKNLPGKPDLVLPKYKAVIFVNGCFWHGHDCPRFTWPKTREAFWRDKISVNKDRDLKTFEALENLGWRIALIWECALKGKYKPKPETVLIALSDWLQSDQLQLYIGYNAVEKTCVIS